MNDPHAEIWAGWQWGKERERKHGAWGLKKELFNRRRARAVLPRPRT